MTSRDFCYWLQGFFEIAKPEALTAEQTVLLKKHLSLVFLHEIDPSAGPTKVQAALNEAHGGPQSPWTPQEPGGPVYRC